VSVFSPSKMNKSVYRAQPIGSVSSLALALNTNVNALQSIAARASSLYASFFTEKKDGTPRPIVSPHKDLKFLQKRINRQIFGNVSFPNYLFGGISERDYVQNANVHKNAKALIALDICNFYPSISEGHVRAVYQNFCKFPKDVADLLTQISTREGKVPQGACTSSNIANLVFFDSEPLLVDYLKQKRLRYSRLLDDITISSENREFSKKEITDIINRVAAMLTHKGMKLKNKKTRVTTKSNPAQLMEVTGLWLNRGKPRIKRSERIDIRADFRNLCGLFKISRISEDYHKNFNRVSGRIAKLSHLEHMEAPFYRARLRTILPHFSVSDVIHLRRQVNGICKTPAEHRSRFEYVAKYNKIKYKLTILRRTDITEANNLRAMLDKCKPTKTKDEIIHG